MEYRFFILIAVYVFCFNIDSKAQFDSLLSLKSYDIDQDTTIKSKFSNYQYLIDTTLKILDIKDSIQFAIMYYDQLVAKRTITILILTENEIIYVNFFYINYMFRNDKKWIRINRDYQTMMGENIYNTYDALLLNKFLCLKNTVTIWNFEADHAYINDNYDSYEEYLPYMNRKGIFFFDRNRLKSAFIAIDNSTVFKFEINESDFPCEFFLYNFFPVR